MTCGVFFNEAPFNLVWTGMSMFSMIATSVLILLCGTALIYVTKPMRVKNLLWLPFVFAYWLVQAFIAFYAGCLSLLKRPKNWLKTEKSGAVNDPAFPQKCNN
jgi:Na+-transporting methylmalonyl-CoA/oxaloacetate decarboxylase beta subunit